LLILPFVIISEFRGFELIVLVSKLLPMLHLKLFVRNLFETQAVVPLVVDSLEKVLLERLRGVLFPEVFHGID